MTQQDITNLRLQNQQISGTQFTTPAELVRWMGAMQAQDYMGAKWAIGLRLGDITEADVEQAVKDRKILRTWPQRGTIHFVVPEEARWRVKLTGERMMSRARSYHTKVGLDEAAFEKAKTIILAALQGDKQLTRPELMKLLETNGISTNDQRGYHILWYLAHTGYICFGPLQGKQVTFALLSDWAPTAKELPHDEALARLVLGYYTSHGPATVQDLMWWSGLNGAEVKSGLALVGTKLVSEEIEGKTYYMVPGLASKPLPSPTVHLLQTFDEYLLGYKDRTAALDLEHAPRIVPGGNGMFMSTVLINGRVEGLWRRTFKKDHVLLEVQQLRDFNAAEMKKLQRAAQKYGVYLGQPIQLLVAGQPNRV